MSFICTCRSVVQKRWRRTGNWLLFDPHSVLSLFCTFVDWYRGCYPWTFGWPHIYRISAANELPLLYPGWMWRFAVCRLWRHDHTTAQPDPQGHTGWGTTANGRLLGDSTFFWCEEISCRFSWLISASCGKCFFCYFGLSTLPDDCYTLLWHSFVVAMTSKLHK